MKVKRIEIKVSLQDLAMTPGLRPMATPATMAAMKIPVPVAESQLRLKMAGSAVGVGTAGGMRKTT